MATQLSKADQVRRLPHLRNSEVAKQLGICPNYVWSIRKKDSDPDYRKRRSESVTRCRRKNRSYYNAYERDRWNAKRRAEARAS
jgi:hypothetical protein